MAYCPKCGANVLDAAFCPQCGTQINVANAENTHAAAYAGVNEDTNPYAAGSQTQNAGAYYGAYNAGPAPVIPGFSEAAKICLTKIVDWKGRASRSEYWYYFLFNVLATFVAAFVLSLIFNNNIQTGPGAVIYSLITFCLGLAGLSAAIRRFHDVDKSGWNYWWVLIPLVGWIYCLILLIREPTHGPNRFGAEPYKR